MQAFSFVRFRETFRTGDRVVTTDSYERDVTHGPWERNLEAVPVGRIVEESFGRPPFVHWERPLRRKVFETWRNERGERLGRWYWEDAP